MREKTFFMVKPDGIARGLTKTILSRITQAGLLIAQQNELKLDPALAAELYSPHLGQSFYPGLLKFITSGPVLACQLEGEEALARVRALMGATDPREAKPGTIRGDLKEENIFTVDKSIKNLVHGSDSPESAARELAIFFKGGI